MDVTHNNDEGQGKNGIIEGIAHYQLVSAAYDKSRFGFGEEGVSMVYDNHAALYLSKPLPRGVRTHTIELEHAEFGPAMPYCGAARVIITLKENDAIRYNDDIYYQPGQVAGQEDRELKRFLELLTTQPLVDCGHFTVNKSGFAHDLKNGRPLPYGLQLLRGIVKGVHLYETGRPRPALRLNVDVNWVPFYPAINVVEALSAFGPLSNPDYQRFLGLYKGVKFTLSYRKTRTYHIDGIADLPADRLTFEKDGDTLTVDDYYRNEYRITLRYPGLPPLKLRSRAPDGSEHYLYFPMEVCDILSGQRLSRRRFSLLAPDFEATLIQTNCLSPRERADMISAAVHNVIQPPDLPENLLAAFGVELSGSYNDIEIVHRERPRLGKNLNFMRGVQFKINRYEERIEVRNWRLLVDERNVNGRVIDEFIQRLQQSAFRQGVVMDAPIVVNFDSNRASPPEWFDMFKAFRDQNVQLIFLVDSQKIKSHNMLKSCEQRFQVLTQHAVVESLRKMKSLDNVFHKMHTKLNGLNYKVDPEPCALKYSLDSEDLFFIGYDVSHPPPAQDDQRAKKVGLSSLNPSVVGVATNSAASPYQFIGDYFYQPSRQESVDAALLQTQVFTALIQRHKNRPRARLPSVIFVVRDGLAEGQYEMARNDELNGIKAAIAQFEPQWHPRFVFIVATKRHHKRFFANGNNNNVPPSSALSLGVARAFTKEFFMLSAQPIKGTSKPPDYVILVNDADFTTDELQGIIQMLCYNHQIVGTPTGLPIPVIQGHELAKRGANNLAQYIRLNRMPETADGSADTAYLNEILRYSGRYLHNQRFNA
uniref:Piwi domain-containing protein n=1 Tax=Panagrellus redivivus TaxID=6233 RepID=A0A7E4URU6_PANRE